MNKQAQLLQDDEAARVAALDVTRSFIVQAPAGSGKTELLIQRYLKLLATVENPEEILAITFTRKAAAEMQHRVLEALKASRRGDEPTESHQQTTAAAAAAVMAVDDELQWQLIANPGRMRIQTLDSLNASIARMQPMSTESSAAHNNIVADAEMSALYRNAAMLTLDQLAETGPMHDATQEVLLHVDINTSLYVAYVSHMLATRDQWLPFVGSGLIGADEEAELRARFEKNLATAVSRYLQRAHAGLPEQFSASMRDSVLYAAEQLTAAGIDTHPFVSFAENPEMPQAQLADLPKWQGLAELLLTRQGQWRKTVNKTQGFPPGDAGQKQIMLDLLQELGPLSNFRELLAGTRDLPPVAYSDEQWSVLLALFRVLPLAVTELKRLFAERGITDYIEVALSAADALGTADEPGDIALLLDYQLRHLLVDEMQDTSSAQYRMLEALTGGWQVGDGRTMFCVGDPMQSIYRFRNAEVGQFLFAKESGIGAVSLEPLTLRRNFRSGEKLVDWFNAVFPDVLAKFDDAAQSAVAYSAAVSVPSLAEQGDCVIHPLYGSDTGAEADRGCDVIAKTLASHPDDDMAVLVRGRSHLSKLLARLRAENIPYRAVEIDRLTDLPEIIDVLSLTRALVHRGDRLAWLAILRSPWAGLDWTDLHALVKDAPHSTVWELLQDEARLASLSEVGQRVVASLFASLRPAMRPNRVETLRDRVERTWLGLGGPAIVGDVHAVENVYRYFDVIERLEKGGTLVDVADLERALDLEHVSSDMNARLQIMTMHRAKGLQFDHVLLFGLGRAPGQHEKSVLSWFDVPAQHGVDEKIISPVGPRADIENDPLHRFIERVEAGKFRHELGRLLYVACTRARKTLHLMGHVSLSADETEVRPARAGSLLGLLWPAVRVQFESEFEAERPASSQQDLEPWLNPELRRFNRPFVLPEFVGPALDTAVGKITDADNEVEFYWVGTEARMAGTLVHRWLQMATDKRVKFESNDLTWVRETTERWLSAKGVGGESSATISRRVEAALLGILSDAKGRWLLEGDGNAELALTGVYDDEITSVILDRVRIDENGRHWIVDYKTSTHEGGNLAAFLQAEVDRYTPQLEKYAQMYRDYSSADVACALYFPLLQEFVEVPL
ncbi:MAG: UvrD-helicase domain-containing protein [Woeseiaceae bacterium]